MFSRKLQYFLTFCLVLGILVFCSNRALAGDGIDFQVNIVDEEEPTSPPPPAAGGFQILILINKGADYTNSNIVTLNLTGGPGTERIAISNFSDFRDAGQETYTSSKTWDLCRGRTSCPEGEHTVFAKFYTSWGTASEAVSDSIIYKKPIPESIVEQLQTKLAEIAAKIAELGKKITQVFKKKVVVEVPEVPPEEIAPPAEEVPPEEEIITPPEKPLEKEKVEAGPINLLKEYGRWLWQNIANFWQKIIDFWQRILPF